MRCNFLSRMSAALLAAVGAAIVATAASARSTAAPTQTSSPTLQGQVAHPFVGDKLTTTNGSWTGSPTKYTYQWDRCDPTGDRVNCVPIPGATEQSYTAATAD